MSLIKDSRENLNRELLISKFNETDFQFYYELVSNKKVMRMITERVIPYEEAKDNYDKILLNNKLDENLGTFKVMDNTTKEFIGLAKLVITEDNRHKAEIGYMILPRYWEQGIGGYLVKRLIALAERQDFIKSIFAIIDPRNTASRKILIKNGFGSKEVGDFYGLPGELLELEIKR